MDNLMRETAAGAIGGLAGGAVVTGAMLAATRAGLDERTLPVKIERWAAYHAGADRKRLKEPVTAEEEMIAQGGHLVVAAALGASYGVLRARLDLPPVATGLLFGLGLHALALGVIGPALTITKKPWNQSAGEHALRLGMHAAFGVIMAVVAERLARRM